MSAISPPPTPLLSTLQARRAGRGGRAVRAPPGPWRSSGGPLRERGARLGDGPGLTRRARVPPCPPSLRRLVRLLRLFARLQGSDSSSRPARLRLAAAVRTPGSRVRVGWGYVTAGGSRCASATRPAAAARTTRKLLPTRSPPHHDVNYSQAGEPRPSRSRCAWSINNALTEQCFGLTRTQ